MIVTAGLTTFALTLTEIIGFLSCSWLSSQISCLLSTALVCLLFSFPEQNNSLPRQAQANSMFFVMKVIQTISARICSVALLSKTSV